MEKYEVAIEYPRSLRVEPDLRVAVVERGRTLWSDAATIPGEAEDGTYEVRAAVRAAGTADLERVVGKVQIVGRQRPETARGVEEVEAPLEAEAAGVCPPPEKLDVPAGPGASADVGNLEIEFMPPQPLQGDELRVGTPNRDSRPMMPIL